MTIKNRFQISVIFFPLVLLTCSPEDSLPKRYPASIESATVAELKHKYDAAEVFELESMRVLVFRDGEADYQVVFYKRGQSGFECFGPEFNLIGFEQPVVRDDPSPAVWTRDISSGESFRFTVTTETVELVPEQGEWEQLRPDTKPDRPTEQK